MAKIGAYFEARGRASERLERLSNKLNPLKEKTSVEVDRIGGEELYLDGPAATISVIALRDKEKDERVKYQLNEPSGIIDYSEALKLDFEDVEHVMNLPKGQFLFPFEGYMDNHEKLESKLRGLVFDNYLAKAESELGEKFQRTHRRETFKTIEIREEEKGYLSSLKQKLKEKSGLIFDFTKSKLKDLRRGMVKVKGYVPGLSIKEKEEVERDLPSWMDRLPEDFNEEEKETLMGCFSAMKELYNKGQLEKMDIFLAERKEGKLTSKGDKELPRAKNERKDIRKQLNEFKNIESILEGRYELLS